MLQQLFKLLKLFFLLIFSLGAKHLDLFQLEELKGDSKGTTNKSTKEVLDDPIDIQRREKVKEAMLHAWSSYEKYAWGQDELMVNLYYEHSLNLLLFCFVAS